LEREIGKYNTIIAPSPSSLGRMMEMLSTYHFRFEHNDNNVKKFISINNRVKIKSNEDLYILTLN